MSLPLSILDLAPVPEGVSTTDALGNVLSLARLGDTLGYTRVWYAEHHGIPSIASSSPEVLIATSAAATQRIHVGSGGVMLPNHVPLRVVETYRTLNAFHPGRIDLGIGRAGGSDGRTLNALRSVDGSYFPQEMAELLAFEQGSFPADHPYAPIRVVPERIALPPIFILGSSGASAAAAGELGVGYSFAAHFSPTPARPAFDAYRDAFRPSAQFERPHAILAVSALVAPTAEEARFLSMSQAVSWALFTTGEERRLLSPKQPAPARSLWPNRRSSRTVSPLDRRRPARGEDRDRNAGRGRRRRRSDGDDHHLVARAQAAFLSAVGRRLRAFRLIRAPGGAPAHTAADGSLTGALPTSTGPRMLTMLHGQRPASLRVARWSPRWLLVARRWAYWLAAAVVLAALLVIVALSNSGMD